MSGLDLLDTEDESDLRAAVRRLLAERTDVSATTRLYDGDRGAVPGLWRSVGSELGLAGLMVPAELGGGGGSVRDAAVVLEELGRAVAPVPFLTSSVIATSLLLDPEHHTRPARHCSRRWPADVERPRCSARSRRCRRPTPRRSSSMTKAA